MKVEIRWLGRVAVVGSLALSGCATHRRDVARVEPLLGKAPSRRESKLQEQAVATTAVPATPASGIPAALAVNDAPAGSVPTVPAAPGLTPALPVSNPAHVQHGIPPAAPIATSPVDPTFQSAPMNQAPNYAQAQAPGALVPGAPAYGPPLAQAPTNWPSTGSSFSPGPGYSVPQGAPLASTQNGVPTAPPGTMPASGVIQAGFLADSDFAADPRLKLHPKPAGGAATAPRSSPAASQPPAHLPLHIPSPGATTGGVDRPRTHPIPDAGKPAPPKLPLELPPPIDDLSAPRPIQSIPQAVPNRGNVPPPPNDDALDAPPIFRAPNRKD